MEKPEKADMLEEYDFSAGERGKYASRYAAGSNVVVLDPDICYTDGARSTADAPSVLAPLPLPETPGMPMP